MALYAEESVGAVTNVRSAAEVGMSLPTGQRAKRGRRTWTSGFALLPFVRDSRQAASQLTDETLAGSPNGQEG